MVREFHRLQPVAYQSEMRQMLLNFGFNTFTFRLNIVADSLILDNFPEYSVNAFVQTARFVLKCSGAWGLSQYSIQAQISVYEKAPLIGRGCAQPS